jgi:AraC-like DNA-binding protein
MRNFHKSPVPPTCRYGWEFYAILRGQCAPVFPTGEAQPLLTRSLWVFRPEMRYGWTGRDRNALRAVFHYAEVPPELEEALEGRDYLVVDLTAAEIQMLERAARNMEAEYARPSRVSHLFYERVLLDLTLLALKDWGRERQIPYQRMAEEKIRRALAYFEIHMEKNPTIEEVADAMHMSSVHLRRLFKATHQKTPHAAFNELKIKRAANLLVTTGETIEVVSRHCGFSDSTDFIRAFRKIKGVSPGAWRRDLLSEPAPGEPGPKRRLSGKHK